MSKREQHTRFAHTHTHGHRVTCIYMVIIYQIFLLCCSHSFHTCSSHISFPFRICVWSACVYVYVCVSVCARTRIFFHFNCCFCFWYAKLCTVYYQWRANPLSLVRLYSFFAIVVVVAAAAALWRNWNIIYRNLEENIIKCIWPIVFARHEALERPDWISIKIAHTPRVHLCVRAIDNSIFSASVTACLDAQLLLWLERVSVCYIV